MSTISTGTTLTTGYVVTSDTTGALVVKTGSGNTTAITIDENQNLGFGGTSFGSGVFVLFIANAVTVPTTNPTNGGVLYVQAGALKYRGSSGTVTTIANA